MNQLVVGVRFEYQRLSDLVTIEATIFRGRENGD